MKKRERKSEKKKSYNHRFFIIGGLFLVISVVFLISLGITQVKGAKYFFPRSDDTIKTETVYGERGKIYDRNGKLLVGNVQTLNFTFEYGSMAAKRKDVNLALLECLNILNETGNKDKRAEDYFPLTGSYPDMSITNDARDDSTNTGYYFKKFREKQNFSEDVTPEKICNYFINKYKLWKESYTDAAIEQLIRIYYDMERIDFGYYNDYVIAEDIDPTSDNGKALITQINEKSVEGASFIKQTKRTYPYDTYAAHILGRIGKITAENVDKYEDYPLDALVGTSGCEAAFEEYLRGSNGKKVSVYNKDGELVEEYYDPEPIVGKDVYLTIDIDLQIAAEDALKEEIERLDDSEAGAATFIDPNNGEILVSASYPTYSQNQFSGVEYYASLASNENRPLLNRAIQGTYAPGSVYKVGTALAALEEGLISSSTCYDCQKVYPKYDDDAPTCLGNHGSIDVIKALEVSCNVFFYYVGDDNGLDKITPYTKSLGLGSPTGVELGERIGIVASQEYCRTTNNLWRGIDNATGAIGQSYHLYSPLQLSVYMSSVINGGTRYSAHLLREVKSVKESVTTEPSVEETVKISSSTHSTIKNAMSRVVSESDTLRRYFSGVNATIGGKTGTAQVTANSTLPDNALFSGFAPYDNPQIVGSCILEAGEAGANASKIVAAVFEEFFNDEPKADDSEAQE